MIFPLPCLFKTLERRFSSDPSLSGIAWDTAQQGLKRHLLLRFCLLCPTESVRCSLNRVSPKRVLQDLDLLQEPDRVECLVNALQAFSFRPGEDLCMTEASKWGLCPIIRSVDLATRPVLFSQLH